MDVKYLNSLQSAQMVAAFRLKLLVSDIVTFLDMLLIFKDSEMICIPLPEC